MLKKFLFFIFIVCMGTISAETIWERDPLEVREIVNQFIMAIEGEKAPVMSIEDLEISMPIRIYSPNEKTRLPAILFIHDGAWIGGNLDTHDNLARYLCSKTESLVISVGYLNSPEGKFPLPLKQCYEALQWIEQNKLASTIAVVGDSAGGNLAAALCLMARDRGSPKIDMQVLINPAPDLTYGSERKNDPFDSIRWQTKMYLSDPNDATNGYVSPLYRNDSKEFSLKFIL